MFLLRTVPTALTIVSDHRPGGLLIGGSDPIGRMVDEWRLPSCSRGRSQRPTIAEPRPRPCALEVHLKGMSNARVTCKTCGCPLPQRTGKGRRRVYCGDACRNVAYLQRRGDAGQQAASDSQPLDQEYAYEVEKVEPLRTRDRSELDRWLTTGQKFDEIIDSPVVLARFMDELLVRISGHALLEDYRYQRSINQLIVIYFMIGRITEGDYTLPTVAR
jgi:hypothetical protein